MDKLQAKRIVNTCIKALPNVMVRNLMEHADNKTPILKRDIIASYFSHKGAGCPAQLAGDRALPSERNADHYFGAVPSAVCTAQITMANGDYEAYYIAHRTLTDTELRRLWIAEGKRRGYEMT